MSRLDKIAQAQNRLDRAVLRIAQANAGPGGVGDVLWERYDMAREAYRQAVIDYTPDTSVPDMPRA